MPRKRKAAKLKSGLSMAKKVAIYIRVSTMYQIDKDSLPMQRKDLIAYSELILERIPTDLLSRI